MTAQEMSDAFKPLERYKLADTDEIVIALKRNNTLSPELAEHIALVRCGIEVI
jgi:hypothetical protein